MTYPVSVRIQFFLYAIVAVVVLSVDRITKLMALQLSYAHQITSFLSFELLLNRGVSWGILHSSSPIIFAIITGIITIIMAMIIAHGVIRLRAGHWIWAEVLIVAGALSNIIDRFVYGGVIDFIHFSYAGWSFPVFNVADMAVVLGVFLLFWEFYQE